MTQRRYRAELWGPTPKAADGCAWEQTVVCSRRFRTCEAAVRQVERWLAKHSIVTTNACYWQDLNRHLWDGRVCDLGKDKSGRVLARDAYLDRDRLSAPVEVVPSVGELGYW